MDGRARHPVTGSPLDIEDCYEGIAEGDYGAYGPPAVTPEGTGDEVIVPRKSETAPKTQVTLPEKPPKPWTPSRGTGDEVLSREDVEYFLLEHPKGSNIERVLRHDAALRRALDEERARSELHADINRDVAEALGQEFGESWHDLGAKVRRALEDAKREHEYSIEQFVRAETRELERDAARERVRQLTEALEEIRQRSYDGSPGITISRIAHAALAAGESEAKG